MDYMKKKSESDTVLGCKEWAWGIIMRPQNGWDI